MVKSKTQEGIPIRHLWDGVLDTIPEDVLLFPDACLLNLDIKAYVSSENGYVLRKTRVSRNDRIRHLAWQARIADQRPVYIDPKILKEVAAGYGCENGNQPVNPNTFAYSHLRQLEGFRLNSLEDIDNPNEYAPVYVANLSKCLAWHLRAVTATMDEKGKPDVLAEGDMSLLSSAAAVAVLSGQPTAVLSLDMKLRFATNIFRDIARISGHRLKPAIPDWYVERLGDVRIFAPNPCNYYNTNG